MKLVLITTSFLFVGLNAYDKVGVARYCNLDPSEFTAECNYDTWDSCQSYLAAGQRCVANRSYQGPSAKPAGTVDQPPSVLLTAWQRSQLQNSWTHRAKVFWYRLQRRFLALIA